MATEYGAKTVGDMLYDFLCARNVKLTWQSSAIGGDAKSVR
jgi:hypothetical protein